MSRKGCASATAGTTLSLLICLSTAADAQQPPRTAGPVAPPAIIFGVGDIMHCAAPEGGDITGRLMERLLDETPGSLAITLGDNSNDDGSELSYDCLNRSSWGRLMGHVFPTPGNHDYGVDKDLPFYFLYFPNAGPLRRGYYAYNVGAWRVYALNTELVAPAARLRQLEWLEQDLRANHASRCVLAYFHRPPFSSGQFASPAWALPIFRILYRYGADLAVTAHEHFFAYLPPLNPDGVVDVSKGVPTIIAGTGGARFFRRPKTLRWGAHGEEIVAGTLGVVRLRLYPGRFDWAFVPAQPMAGTPPSGAGRCHANPSN
ncbi:MAG: hypothetical protein FJW14_01755 [Acidimicrobiia bacterium]|nr:hypothetical protein [Acidimicrobiia bacterium]